jgi:hypothetical protein
MCFVRISEQTETFALHGISISALYNLGGECLLRGTDCTLIRNKRVLLLSRISQ